MDNLAKTAGGLLSPRDLSAEEQEKKRRLIEAGEEAFDAEDYMRALDCFHRASILDSSDGAVWCTLAMAYANLDMPREAWRSYKLALLADPDDGETLWYAAEFLFNIEDFSISRVFLERYIAMEGDVRKQSEAQELLKEVLRQIGDDDEIRERPRYTGSDDPEIFEDDDEEDLDGFELEDEFGESDSDDEDLDDLFDAPLDEDHEFQANLNLELTGMRSKCSKCSVALPLDAPYCYNCLAPHIYGS
ncbi:hypothetical protein JW859_12465 [bacterium]|nr:hypothetical protein [bacterium]